MSELRVDLSGEVAQTSSAARLYRILALSGGGYRGLFTARILVHLEERAECKPAEIFDLMIGTSTGALIAAALSLKVAAQSIEKAYRKSGPLIFKNADCSKVMQYLRRTFIRAPYSSAALYAAIRDLIGEKLSRTPLRDLDIPLLVTAVSHTREQLRLFGGGKFASIGQKITLEDAIVASAAAPTYFPSTSYLGENLVDGGLVANAPELVGIAEARKILGIALEDIRVLAIGTASPAEGLLSMSPDNRGILRWLLSKRGLVRLTMSAQEHLTRQLTKQFLTDNYIIIDKPPGSDQATLLSKMDNTSKAMTDTLLVLAEIAWSEFIADARHRLFLGPDERKLAQRELPLFE